MSKALQCDRCRRFFDMHGDILHSAFINPKVLCSANGNSHVYGLMFGNVNRSSDHDLRIDLCIKCTRDFWKFMNQEVPDSMKEGDNNEKDHMPEMRNGDV